METSKGTRISTGAVVIAAGVGAFVGLLRVFSIYPDVIISKGGYAAFPAVFAAKLLHIPLIIHESDSYPGRYVKVIGSKLVSRRYLHNASMDDRKIADDLHMLKNDYETFEDRIIEAGRA